MNFNYKEGTVFAMKLEPKGFAIGVVARMSNNGKILGYFFGEKYFRLPTMDLIGELNCKKAIRTVMVGGDRIIKKKWPIIGEIENWNRKKWPIPDFLRVDVIIPNLAFRIHYSDDLEETGMTRTSVKSKLEEDCLFGGLSLEIELSEMISKLK